MLNDCSRSETKREGVREGEKERERRRKRRWKQGSECCKLSQTMPYADATHNQEGSEQDDASK